MSSNDSKITELEHAILGALCGASRSAESRNHAIRTLATYDWAAPDHRVIYHALRRSGNRTDNELCEYLKAEVTRLGFPDMEWELYLAVSGAPAADAEILIRELLRSAPDTR